MCLENTKIKKACEVIVCVSCSLCMWSCDRLQPVQGVHAFWPMILGNRLQLQQGKETNDGEGECSVGALFQLAQQILCRILTRLLFLSTAQRERILNIERICNLLRRVSNRCFPPSAGRWLKRRGFRQPWPFVSLTIVRGRWRTQFHMLPTAHYFRASDMPWWRCCQGFSLVFVFYWIISKLLEGERGTVSVPESSQSSWCHFRNILVDDQKQQVPITGWRSLKKYN